MEQARNLYGARPQQENFRAMTQAHKQYQKLIISPTSWLPLLPVGFLVAILSDFFSLSSLPFTL